VKRPAGWGGWLLALVLVRAAPVAAAEPGGTGQAALEQAALAAQADIRRDTAALNELRDRIARERRPLAERLERLQTSVREKRAEVERIRFLRRQGEQEQAALEARAAALEDECRFLQALFAEYARAMETRVGPAEAPRLVRRLAPLRDALAADDGPAGMADAIGRLLALSAELNRERLGGCRFTGAALDAAGIEQDGMLAVAGPAAWFAADGGGPAGMARTRSGTLLPAVHDNLPDRDPQAIRALAAGEAAVVPVDVTDGDALRVADARPSLAEHLKQGGFVMAPLMLVGLVAAVLTLWKAWELSRVRVRPDERLEAVMTAVGQGRIAEARDLAAALPPPVRTLVQEAVEHRDSPRDNLEEIMHEHVLMALPRLERHLGTLAVLGGIAPLLGLLGTVTGMIHTFQLVTGFGSGDAKLLSGGISEALVTTETGLAIAIPVLLAHAFLARRARGILNGLEGLALQMINRLQRHGGAA